MTLESLEQEVISLRTNNEELWRVVRDHSKRFDTLQTPLWKRVWFRIDGWPGIKDLNATQRKQRPWH